MRPLSSLILKFAWASSTLVRGMAAAGWGSPACKSTGPVGCSAGVLQRELAGSRAADRTGKTGLAPSHLFFERPGKTQRLDVSMSTDRAVMSEKSHVGNFLGRAADCILGLAKKQCERWTSLSGFYFFDLPCPEWYILHQNGAAVLFGGRIGIFFN